MSKFRYYITSFRLRTLPLSLSGIFLGTLLAISTGFFKVVPFCLAIATTLCLQILSNLANELGDLQKGTDNARRVGPIRSIQSGDLTLREFKKVIGIFIILSACFGTALVFSAFEGLFSLPGIIMLLLGAASIIAAIKYTVGKNAYGYRGLGDLFVFLFFGLLSTAGSFFLMAHSVPAIVFLPAAAIGLLSSGVLNMNNIRDIENDEQCGKRTLPVILGEKRAKIYQYVLITGAFACMAIYVLADYHSPVNLIFLFTLPLFMIHLCKVSRNKGRQLDPQLRFLSLATLLFALSAGCGQLF